MCQREAFEKDWEKETPRSPEMHRNHTQTHTHTNTHHFCHSRLSFLPSLSLCGLQIDKTTHILKPRDKQLIIYVIVATKIHFAARELYAHTHTHTHTLQETEWAIARKPWRWEGWVSSALLHCYHFAYVILIQLIWPALQTWNDGRCFLSVSPQRNLWLREVFILKWTVWVSPIDKIKWYWFHRCGKQSWGLHLLQAGCLICTLISGRWSMLLFPDSKGHI